MNEQIKKLIDKAGSDVSGKWLSLEHAENLVKLAVEETLKEVGQRTYGRGENQWYYEQDEQWVKLHFGYGPLTKR